VNELTQLSEPQETVLCEVVEDGVILTIHAPATRNACTIEMRQALLGHLETAMTSASCRFIILTGAAANFCSGGRLAPGAEPDVERTRRNVGILQDVVRALHQGPKPTVAAVEGVSFGAGLSLAAACDFVVAGEGARFCASFGRVGLMPDGGLAWTLPHRVGHTVSRDMMLTAREVQAPEAHHIGLVDQVVGEGKALEGALGAARRYLGIAPLALAATKRLLGGLHASLDDMLAAELDEQGRLTETEDYSEGRAAFRDKRPARFSGR
jgi:2-(1,2-epoxy-1,2-dihydrophenyl)acetyl-CoA isomerase